MESLILNGDESLLLLLLWLTVGGAGGDCRRTGEITRGDRWNTGEEGGEEMLPLGRETELLEFVSSTVT